MQNSNEKDYGWSNSISTKRKILRVIIPLLALESYCRTDGVVAIKISIPVKLILLKGIFQNGLI
ncbi:MAG TPA: hypothetical protein VI146_04270 [Nitrososphaeraceae archaeon]